ncbi:hypothetical protein B0H14DRAFT_990063, partial [Mycena olivaceomarginata]
PSVSRPAARCLILPAHLTPTWPSRSQAHNHGTVSASPRLITFKNSRQAYVEPEEGSTSMGTGSHLPLTLFSLLHLCADFSVASECAVACTPTPQPRRHPNLNTRCHCSTHPAPLTIHRLPCTPRPILDLSLHDSRAAVRLRARCTRYETRLAVRLRTRVAAPSILIHSLPCFSCLRSSLPPSLPHSSRHHFPSSFPSPLSLAPPTVPPLHASPRAIAHWSCSTCCADVYPRPCRCRMLAAWHLLAELGFTADKLM